jgi:DNA-binding NarL/FixJ family response regulator
METTRPSTLAIKTMLLCGDTQFLGITRSVLNELGVRPRISGSAESALGMLQSEEFEVIVVDWREMDNVADFLAAVRRSKLNYECVLVAIVRDLLDLKQAFAAGVHFLIHKPASAVQIERCLRAAYCATVGRRRKHHREPVHIVASAATRKHALADVLMVNLSERGAGLATRSSSDFVGISFDAGEEVELRFALPEREVMINITGIVVWTTADGCGIRFRYIPEDQRLELQAWITECVERSLRDLRDRVQEVCA